MRDGTGQKIGSGWKNREENHSHFFVELLLEHVTVNEMKQDLIWHPSRKRNKGQYFLYALPFYKQPVYKQTFLAC